MNKQEAMSIMQHGSHSDKLDYLNDLDTAFDTYNRNVANSDEVVDALINFALASRDEELTNEILEVIRSAQISQDLTKVDYSKIAQNINVIPEKFLPRYIDILGNTGDAKYLSIILSLQNHKNKKVQESVKDALIELRISNQN